MAADTRPSGAGPPRAVCAPASGSLPALDHVWSEALAGEPDGLRLMKPQLEGAIDRLQGLPSRFDDVDHAQRLLLTKLLMSVSYGARVPRQYDPDALQADEAADLLEIASQLVVSMLSG